MAKKEDIVQKLRAMNLDGAITADPDYKAGVAYTVRASLGKLREVASAFNEAEFYLESLTGLDFKDTAELVYHFNCYEPKSRVVLRVLCGHDETPPTVSDIFSTSAWQEREVHEFFGIGFDGNADMRQLLLPEDMDIHPLKKTFGKTHAYCTREEIYG